MEHATPEVFPCFKCGACCLDITEVPEISSWATKEGTCRYFDAGKCECQIYDRRPTACNVWKAYRRSYEDEGISWDDFVYTNMLNCVLLRYLNGIDEPEGSPFEGMQEDIASTLLHDLKNPRMERPSVPYETDENDGVGTDAQIYAADATAENAQDEDDKYPQKTSGSKREKLVRASEPAPIEEPLENQSIDLDVPDLGIAATKSPSVRPANKHRGELLR